MSVFEGPEMSITELMRERLHPLGTANISRLQMDNAYVNYDFVLACIEELDRMPLYAALGEKPSNLEKLAYMLLCDSAYIQLDKVA